MNTAGPIVISNNGTTTCVDSNYHIVMGDGKPVSNVMANGQEVWRTAICATGSVKANASFLGNRLQMNIEINCYDNPDRDTHCYIFGAPVIRSSIDSTNHTFRVSNVLPSPVQPFTYSSPSGCKTCGYILNLGCGDGQGNTCFYNCYGERLCNSELGPSLSCASTLNIGDEFAYESLASELGVCFRFDYRVDYCGKMFSCWNTCWDKRATCFSSYGRGGGRGELGLYYPQRSYFTNNENCSYKYAYNLCVTDWATSIDLPYHTVEWCEECPAAGDDTPECVYYYYNVVCDRDFKVCERILASINDKCGNHYVWRSDWREMTEAYGGLSYNIYHSKGGGFDVVSLTGCNL